MAQRRPSKPNTKAATGARAHAALVDVISAGVGNARALWASGRIGEGADAFDRAIRQEPDNVQAYVVAARSYAERFDFERMDRTLEALVRRAPDHPGVHHYVAETYGLLRLPDRALASFERAAAQVGAGPPTWMELASLYERAHRLDEAQDMIERAVRSGYDFPLVWLVRGRIERRRKQANRAEATFRALVARAGPD